MVPVEGSFGVDTVEPGGTAAGGDAAGGDAAGVGVPVVSELAVANEAAELTLAMVAFRPRVERP